MKRLLIIPALIGALVLVTPVLIGFGLQQGLIERLEEWETAANRFQDTTEIGIDKYDRGLFSSRVLLHYREDFPANALGAGSPAHSFRVPAEIEVQHGPIVVTAGKPRVAWAGFRASADIAAGFDDDPTAANAFVEAAIEQSALGLLRRLITQADGQAGASRGLLGVVPRAQADTAPRVPADVDAESPAEISVVTALRSYPPVEASGLVALDGATRMTAVFASLGDPEPQADVSIRWDGGTMTSTSRSALGGSYEGVFEALAIRMPYRQLVRSVYGDAPREGMAELYALMEDEPEFASMPVEVRLEGARVSGRSETHGAQRDDWTAVSLDGFGVELELKDESAFVLAVPKSDLVFGGSSEDRPDGGGVESGDLRIEVPEIRVRLMSEALPAFGFYFDFAMHGLDTAALKEINELLLQSQSKDPTMIVAAEHVPALKEAMLELVSASAPNNPELIVKELRLVIGDQDIVANARAEFNDLDVKASSAEPAQLIEYLRASVGVAVTPGLANDIAREMASPLVLAELQAEEMRLRMQAEEPIVPVTDEEFEAAVTTAADEIMANVIAEGWLRSEEDRLVADFELDRGVMLLNGAPFRPK